MPQLYLRTENIPLVQEVLKLNSFEIALSEAPYLVFRGKKCPSVPSILSILNFFRQNRVVELHLQNSRHEIAFLRPLWSRLTEASSSDRRRRH